MSDDTPGPATPPTAPIPATPPTQRPGSALLAEAANKSGLLWIDIPGDRAWPAWHAWVGDTAYVVNGPGEQTLPWLPRDVVLILRSKDTGGRLLTVAARTEVITPDHDDWETATFALRAGRLNGLGDMVTRWAQEATVTALRPHGHLIESPGRYDDGSGAAPPAPTDATTRTWHPWHLRGRPRWRRGTRRPER